MIKNTAAKTLILAGIVTLSTVSANANASKTGIYVGAALGGSALTGTNNLFINRTFAGAALPLNFNTRISDRNVDGDIFLGYGKRINCVWLGAELIAAISSLTSRSSYDLTETGSGQTVTTKSTWGWGGAINLGYYLNATTKLYVKLGIESRRFRTSFNNSDSTVPTLLSLSKSTRSTAFVPGLGMETDLTHCFSVRAEYRTALHQTKTITTSSAPFSVTTIKTKPAIHYFTLGLTYKI